MKNNKGFTLIELLAIVIILAVIIIVSAPSISKEINKSEEENKNILNQKIENAAHLYAAKYYADKIVNCTESFGFTLNDLEIDGLLDLKNKCEGQKNFEITYDCSNYNYNKIKDGDCYN